MIGTRLLVIYVAASPVQQKRRNSEGGVSIIIWRGELKMMLLAVMDLDGVCSVWLGQVEPRQVTRGSPRLLWAGCPASLLSPSPCHLPARTLEHGHRALVGRSFEIVAVDVGSSRCLKVRPPSTIPVPSCRLTVLSQPPPDRHEFPTDPWESSKH